jgi:hypothetical protein|tara:strand:- start:337 stop:645 length:309 start_codon:yes stop_codon:yes gene_type:complete
MRRISFIFAILGISFLFYIFLFAETKIESFEDLDKLEINSQIILEGVVTNEKDFGNFKILTIKEIDVVCNCKKSYLDEKLFVEGIVSEYLGKKQVKVLSIKL